MPIYVYAAAMMIRGKLKRCTAWGFNKRWVCLVAAYASIGINGPLMLIRARVKGRDLVMTRDGLRIIRATPIVIHASSSSGPVQISGWSQRMDEL